jgi:hypothetical protein
MPDVIKFQCQTELYSCKNLFDTDVAEEHAASLHIPWTWRLQVLPITLRYIENTEMFNITITRKEISRKLL